MTKKAMIIAGVIGGVLVIGGIGSAFNKDKDNDSSDINSSISQSVVSSVDESSSSLVSEAESVLSAASNSETQSDSIISETSNEISDNVNKEYDYDTLQSFFISITNIIDEDELKSKINDNSLFFSSKEYNKVDGGKTINYKVAYTQGSAAQSHADSGDYLEVVFDKTTGTLQYAHYVKSGSSASALFYNYGSYYDFRDENSEEYAGYYISDPLTKNEGITIKYKNGNESKTNFFKYDTAKETINFVIDNAPENSSTEQSNRLLSSKSSEISTSSESKPQSNVQENEGYSDVSSVLSNVSIPMQSSISSSSSNNTVQQTTTGYILNTNTKVFHYPKCSSVSTIKDEHKASASSRDEAINSGYKPCGRCKP